jgi:uroporphyrinogen III methyltransferase/synthase
VVPAYRTLEASPESFAEIGARLAQGSIDIVTFTSPSTLTRLLDGLGSDGPALLARATIAAIGPITAQAIEQRGLEAEIEADDYTAQGLVDALVAHARRGREPRGEAP